MNVSITYRIVSTPLTPLGINFFWETWSESRILTKFPVSLPARFPFDEVSGTVVDLDETGASIR